MSVTNDIRDDRSVRPGSALLTAGASLFIVGLLTAFAGLLVGERSVTAHASVGDSTVNCGTAFHANANAESNDNLARGLLGEAAGNVCANRLHDRRVVTYVLLGAGGGLAVLALAGLVIPGVVVRSNDRTVGTDI